MPTGQTDLAELVRRLEAATTRLEDLGGRGTLPSTVSASINCAAVPSVVVALDELIAERVAVVVSGARLIGSVVAVQAAFLMNCFVALRNVVLAASLAKKPATISSDQKLAQELASEIAKSIEKVVEIKEKNRADPLFSHLTMVADGIPALAWVLVEPTPVPYVGEMRDAAQFFCNRVIKEFKDKDKNHVVWANSYITLLTELQAYVKKWHTTGLSWNPKGDDFKNHVAKLKLESNSSTTNHNTTNSTGNNNTSNASSPPPPPAPAVGLSSLIKGGPPDLSGIFNQLSVGDKVTMGLKKVDKSQMTHKNPDLRASSVVKANAIPSTTVKVSDSIKSAIKKPPKLALEGNKWAVEYQDNNHDISITDVSIKQSIYIFNCINSTIHIKGKVNSVSLDNCRKVAVVIDSVVATVDVVNCKTIQLQITHTSPTISIDKTDGCQVYLSHETLDVTEIYTAKSSEVNVLLPPAKGTEDDYIEKPLSEQFKTVVKGGRMVTVPVEHAS